MQTNPSYEKIRPQKRSDLFLAEKEGFEPSIPFWGIHDFQSCALGQLRDFSISDSPCGQLRYITSFLRICQPLNDKNSNLSKKREEQTQSGSALKNYSAKVSRASVSSLSNLLMKPASSWAIFFAPPMVLLSMFKGSRGS